MNKSDVKQWLDSMIDAQERYMKLRGVYDKDGLCAVYSFSDKRLHIAQGIDIIAEALGEKLSVKNREDDNYPYEYYLKYMDYTVFQISEKEVPEWMN